MGAHSPHASIHWCATAHSCMALLRRSFGLLEFDIRIIFHEARTTVSQCTENLVIAVIFPARPESVSPWKAAFGIVGVDRVWGQGKHGFAVHRRGVSAGDRGIL